MKLARVRLRNFRCYDAEVSIDVGDITAIIGKNDAGKSTILEGLKIFFDDEKPDSDDASICGDKGDVRIICEFDEVSEKIVIDSEFETTLSDEYLLNGDGRLEIHKVYNCKTGTPRLTGVFAAALHPQAEGAGDLLQLKVNDLKARAKDLGVSLEGVPKSVKAAIRRKIWESIGNLKPVLSEVPLASESGKDIWDQLQKRLPVFALFKSDRPSTDQDPEAQDPMKLAVKEALKQKADELAAIATHVEQEVKAIAERTVSKLCEMNPELAKQLTPQFSPPKWDSVFKMSLTGDGQIPVNKRGSGVRRLILLNFFRAKAEQKCSEAESGRVIYAIEEPETSQHPDNQKMLMEAFQELSEQPGCQVILTTHTPMLARTLPADSLRYVDNTPGQPRKVHGSSEGTWELVRKALGVIPDHQVKIFVGIEGRHDINFLISIADILKKAGENVPDLGKLEADGTLVFVPLGGSNLELWVSRLANLNRPEFYICDRDEAPPKQPKYHSFMADVNKRDGCLARCTKKREMENYIHPDAIVIASRHLHKVDVTLTFGDFDDVPQLAAEDLHAKSGAGSTWAMLDKDKQRDKISKAKRWLNTHAIAAMTPQLLDKQDPDGDLRSWFDDIRRMIG